ncbi:MAG: NUDIX domain-containing protein [Nocardioidaceae bacterium]|nr:NUDIX domain-containing protein [Nocardioidaceae bacterium]
MDPGESPAEAARRELSEGTGYAADSIQLVPRWCRRRVHTCSSSRLDEAAGSLASNTSRSSKTVKCWSYGQTKCYASCALKR